MTFKEFLIMEAGDSGSDFFYGLQLLPSDAFDFTPASVWPAEVHFLQKRWKTEKGQGRDFMNIDYDRFQKIRYTSVESKEAPDTKSGFWRHRPDSGSSLKVVKDQDMVSIGYGKTTKPSILTKVNKNFDVQVDKIFGDKGTGKSPVLPDNFDKPFRKVYENLIGYDVVDTMPTNTGMGIASKYVGPDDTATNAPEEEIPMADFGFDRKQKRRRRKFRKPLE